MAEVNVPAVFTHEVEEVKEIALLQRLFAGCAKQLSDIKINPPV